MTDSSTSNDQTVLVLYQPRLPGATAPVVGAHYGVPQRIHDLMPFGCEVVVDSYFGQIRGDTVSLNLNGETALDSRQTQGVDDAVTLYIPKGKLLPGMVNRLTYTVTRGSANEGTSEPPLEILYNKIRPGNQDRDPGVDGHSELVLLLPDEIKNGVGPGFTQATVCVEYPYCRAHDLIRLNCNGHDVYHTVTQTQAPPPPEHGSPIPTQVCFEVTSADLSDHPEFKFSFTVNDQLNNGPDTDSPWSAVHTVEVDQAGARLPAPTPREISSDVGDDPSTIDLEKLSGNPLLLIVLTTDSRFQPGDTIEATYATKLAGQPDVVVTGTVETDDFGQKRPCILQIPNDKVVPGSTVEISYVLLRGGALVGSSRTARATVVGVALELPAPLIKEAPTGVLDPTAVPNGATVQIPLEAGLKNGDSGLVRWVGLSGAGSIDVPYTVVTTDVGQIKEVTVPLSVVEANVDQPSIKLDYTLQRQSGGEPVASSLALYDVRRQVGSGQLLVMGARRAAAWWSYGNGFQHLTALNAATLQPLEAFWKYEDEITEVRGTMFDDTQPSKLLSVRTADDQVWLNPTNIFGNGAINNDVPNYAHSAFVARRNEGNLVAWGVAGSGGTLSGTIITFNDIVEVGRASYAFAARRATGRVVAWGNTNSGGTVPEQIGTLSDIAAVVGNAHAFAARRISGHVVSWGLVFHGGAVPGEISVLDDIIGLSASSAAFCALRENGTVVAWGAAPAGSVPPDIAALQDIAKTAGNDFAFAAIRATRQVVAWGDQSYGGKVSDAIKTLDDIVAVVGASMAFAALRVGGKVVAWGSSAWGGSVPGDIAVLDDIVEVIGNYGAFAARRANGQMVAWGAASHGGTVPSDLVGIDDVVQLATTGGAFAALRRNGTVVAWGHAAWGGNISAVVDELIGVLALYANSQAFAALTSDGRVITWGLADAGGNSSAVKDKLWYQATYRATPASRGAGRKLEAHSQAGPASAPIV